MSALRGAGKLSDAKKANYESILNETKHYVGRNFKQDKGQAKRMGKASKALAKDKFARTHKWVEKSGRMSQGHWEKIQPGQAPNTVLG